MDEWTTWNDFDPRDAKEAQRLKPASAGQLTPLIYDWDIHQWATAIDRIGIGGTTQKYINELRMEYPRRYGCEPLAMKLIGSVPASEESYQIAQELFRHSELITMVDLTKESALAFGDA